MDEPSFLLRAVMWHFGSGDAFFVGWGLFTLCFFLRFRGIRESREITIEIGLLVWLALANAISWVLLLCFISALIGGFVFRRWRRSHRTPSYPSYRSTIGVVVIALMVLGSELLWVLPLRPVAPDAASVAIIGDSVTAGLNAGDHTWPRQLAEATGRTVFDASQQGATVKSAMTQLEKLDGRGDVLWIEIGGNDILESLPSHVYAEQLDQLLAAATKRYPKVVLMEIPAPPGGKHYGDEQRRLALKYHLPLVPKRQLLSVLTSQGSTQDGVHLANAGHTRMATVVQRNLGWPNHGSGKENGHHTRCE